MKHCPVVLVTLINYLVFITGSSAEGENDKTKDYVTPLNTPVKSFEIQGAFDNLTEHEKLYAHYMSRASWYGGLAIPVQTSPEAPAIVSILLKLFKSGKIAELEEVAKNKCQFSDDDWRALVVYSARVFHNIGNYRGFKGTKTLPGVKVELFEKLLSVTKILDEELVKEMWNAVKDKMYSLSDNEKRLGHFANEGVTTYFSSNCTERDGDLVARFMESKKIEGWMTRVFKTAEKSYEIRTAAVKTSQLEPISEAFEGITFTLTTGDYSYFMKKVCENLQKARQYATPMEDNILNHYNNSFRNGSLAEHKNASSLWLDNKNPTIETVIGFIETDRDPARVQCRSEFEGIVAIVDKSKKEKDEKVVKNADKIFACLPWKPLKDSYIVPLPASWQVLTYATSSIQSAIELTNYEDITKEKGVKTFTVSNLTPSKSSNFAPCVLFLSDDDKTLLNTQYKRMMEIRTSLFEFAKLSAKELRQERNIKGGENVPINFPKELINPITKIPVIHAKVYEHDEKFEDVFVGIHAAYEACRKQCIVSYLFLFDEVLQLHEVKPEEFEAMKRAHLIFAVQMVLLEFKKYVRENKSGEQTPPKMQAKENSDSHDGWKTNQWGKGVFAMLKIFLEVGLVEIKEHGNGDLIISVETTKIHKVMQENKLKPFIEKLSVYKATADLKGATAMLKKYAAVSDDSLKWHDVIVRTIDGQEIKPPPISLCHNTIAMQKIDGGEHAVLKTYETTHKGIIESWVDRFMDDMEDICEELRMCWLKDRDHFKYSPQNIETKTSAP